MWCISIVQWIKIFPVTITFLGSIISTSLAHIQMYLSENVHLPCRILSPKKKIQLYSNNNPSKTLGDVVWEGKVFAFACRHPWPKLFQNSNLCSGKVLRLIEVKSHSTYVLIYTLKIRSITFNPTKKMHLGLIHAGIYGDSDPSFILSIVYGQFSRQKQNIGRNPIPCSL